MAKKKPRSRSNKAKELPSHAQKRLHEAGMLLRQDKLAKAEAILNDLNKQHPGNREILSQLANLHVLEHDFRSLQKVCEQMLEVAPNSAGLTLRLAGVLMQNGRPALAVQLFQRFLNTWPDHPDSGKARQSVEALTALLAAEAVELHAPGVARLELAAMHEQIQIHLERGEYEKVHQLSGKLLAHCPQFAATYNNEAQAYFFEGKPDLAVAAEQKVLDFAPDNLHALSNLTRFLCLSGQVDRARGLVKRLLAASMSRDDALMKKLEALSFLGEDQAMVELWQASARTAADGSAVQAMVRHLAAVAHYRLGHEKKALALWKEALQMQPGLDLARENLADAQKPVSERHAAWAYTLNYFLPVSFVDDFSRIVDRAKKDNALATQLLLEKFPQVPALIPLLLDRGDPFGRELALRLAKLISSPATLAALRDFALSQRGPDQMRVSARQIVSEAKLLPPGPRRMWMQGKWLETELLGWEIYSEPDEGRHSPEVADLMANAVELLHKGEGVRAEQLLKKALQLEPDGHDIQNNLASAYELQGRRKESQELLERIHKQHPDYSFARITLARMEIGKGKLKEAAALLQPVMQKHRLHVSALSALAQAEIELGVAHRNADSVLHWLDILEDAIPDHPALKHYAPLREMAGLPQGVGKRGRPRRM